MAQSRREIADILADHISENAEKLEETLKIGNANPDFCSYVLGQPKFR